MKTYKVNDFFNTDLSVNWDFVWSIPEFKILETIEQSPKWHSEGNVKIHTEMVVNDMIKRNKPFEIEVSEYYYKIKVMSALCHDLGKATRSSLGNDGQWHAYGHEVDSEKITRKLLWNEASHTRETICVLVKNHMVIKGLLESKNLFQDLIELSQNLSERGASLEMLFELMMSDNHGSIPTDKELTVQDNVKIGSMVRVAKSLNIYNHCSVPFENTLPHNIIKRRKNNIKEIEVLFMMGLPGGGKDTYIKELIECHNNAVVLCRDDIRTELGLCNENEKIVGTPEQEVKVTEIFNQKLEKAINDGKELIIINNVNLRKKHRKSIRELISKYCKGKYYPVFNIQWIETTIEKHIERRKNQINEDVFENMIMSIDWPTMDEYNSLSMLSN